MKEESRLGMIERTEEYNIHQSIKCAMFMYVLTGLHSPAAFFARGMDFLSLSRPSSPFIGGGGGGLYRLRRHCCPDFQGLYISPIRSSRTVKTGGKWAGRFSKPSRRCTLNCTIGGRGAPLGSLKTRTVFWGVFFGGLDGPPYYFAS